MRPFYFLILLGLLTACTNVSQTPEVEPQPQNLKTLNSVQYQITDLPKTGIEKVKRQGSDNRSPIIALISPSQNPLNLSGELRISGSNISLPISRAIAEKFIEDGFPDKVHLSGSNTETGLKRFCEQGDIDIVDSSRLLTTDELETCRRFKREPIAFPIAQEKVLLVVSNKNTFALDNWPKAKLRKIFTANNWSEVDSEWPKVPIKRIFPSDVVSRIEFVQMTRYFNLEGESTQWVSNDNTFFYDFVEQLQAKTLLEPYMIGILGYSSYQKDQDIYRGIVIDGVKWSQSNYPFYRTLYIYADANQIRQRPELQALLHYYLTYSNEVSKELGFFPVSGTYDGLIHNF